MQGCARIQRFVACLGDRRDFAAWRLVCMRVARLSMCTSFHSFRYLRYSIYKLHDTYCTGNSIQHHQRHIVPQLLLRFFPLYSEEGQLGETS